LSAGWASDLLGPYNVVAIACYIAGILSLALWVPTSTQAGLIAFSVLFGFFSGAYIALAASMVVRISPFREIGYRTGLLFLAASISGLTASPIGGAILAREGGSYVGMQVFSGLTLIVGSSFVLTARFTKTGMFFFAKF
jgi:MFS family permease